MNGKRAKAIKQEVYGDEYSPKFRQYYRKKGAFVIQADPRRQAYQKAKKAWTRRNR